MYISYANENNRNGWVDRFRDALAEELEELLGRPFSSGSVFLDKTPLRAGMAWPQELAKAVENSALLIAILSPSYITSQWCDREREAFFRGLPKGADPANRVCPVLVRPIDSLPEPFREIQYFSFVSDDKQEPVANGSPEWTSRLNKLAVQLKVVLQELRGRSEGPDKPPKGPRKARKSRAQSPKSDESATEPTEAPEVELFEAAPGLVQTDGPTKAPVNAVSESGEEPRKTDSVSTVTEVAPTEPSTELYEPERVSAHGDDPAMIDELGRRPFAEVLAARIEEVWHAQKETKRYKGSADRKQEMTGDVGTSISFHQIVS